MPRKETDWPKLLRRIAKRTGKTHAELAASIGVARGTWRCWLYGHGTPSGSAQLLIRMLYLDTK